jgi:hypothetical protein
MSARSLGGVLGAAALACAPETPQFPDAASDGASTSAASDDAASTAISDAATSSGSSSDEGVVDDTARGTDASGTTDATGASLETTATSDDMPSTTDTGPSPGEPYAACPGGDADCPLGAICIEVMLQDGNVLATVCGVPCTRDEGCASFGMGDMPVCFPLVMGAACALSCEGGGMLCPPGMECTETTGGSLCAWPSGMG